MSMANEIANGEVCGVCLIPFEKAHGYPVACMSCFDDGSASYEDFSSAVYDSVECENKEIKDYG